MRATTKRKRPATSPAETALYRGGRPPVDVAGETAIVVDDGVATGGTAIAALRWARAAGAAEVILAVPVAPPQSRRTLESEADRVVALAFPEPFHAVGQWYRDFDQVPDEAVVALLRPPGGDDA